MIGPGIKLGNRYRLDERIASGGMGDVWRGTDEVLGRTVAVKILLPALLDEPGFAERFRGEARTMATINHPGVVDVYDYGSDQQVAFLVMEYVEGDALSRTLSRVGRLTPGRTMALVAQAAEALHAAHEKGIVHRDVKPGNLLVRPNGTLVLTDFGIARSAMVGQLTAAGTVLGTASYISPEQAAGQVATPASDIYSLGVVAYQCLSGRRPFEGGQPARDRHEARPRDASSAAHRHPAGGARDRRTGNGQGSGCALAERGGSRRGGSAGGRHARRPESWPGTSGAAEFPGARRARCARVAGGGGAPWARVVSRVGRPGPAAVAPAGPLHGRATHGRRRDLGGRGSPTCRWPATSRGLRARPPGPAPAGGLVESAVADRTGGGAGRAGAVLRRGDRPLEERREHQHVDGYDLADGCSSPSNGRRTRRFRESAVPSGGALRRRCCHDDDPMSEGRETR